MRTWGDMQCYEEEEVLEILGIEKLATLRCRRSNSKKHGSKVLHPKSIKIGQRTYYPVDHMENYFKALKAKAGL